MTESDRSVEEKKTVVMIVGQEGGDASVYGTGCWEGGEGGEREQGVEMARAKARELWEGNVGSGGDARDRRV